jgi:uncharacterized membrane protein
MDSHILLKTAHVLSAAIIFGGGLAIAFHCWFGYRSAIRRSDIASLRTVLRLTVWADACLTAPAVVFQVVSGLVLMRLAGWSLLSPWSILVWTLFALVGACWLPVLAIQVSLSRSANAAASTTALPARFHALFHIWLALGVPAFAAVLVIFYLMLAKPYPTV